MSRRRFDPATSDFMGVDGTTFKVFGIVATIGLAIALLIAAL